jgi:hypothetical protein
MWKICKKHNLDYNDKLTGGCPECMDYKQRIIQEELDRQEKEKILEELGKEGEEDYVN